MYGQHRRLNGCYARFLEHPPLAFYRKRENLIVNAAIQLREHDTLTERRALADQAFSRAAGAPLVGGNSVRLLKNTSENYPAWLDAIGAAKRYIHFESYIIQEDDMGRKFADGLIGKAREGVRSASRPTHIL
jgi:phosphatidylserine/phosphatidylglycerophosphate/cardiolipin synthase-like enzyme